MYKGVGLGRFWGCLRVLGWLGSGPGDVWGCRGSLRLCPGSGLGRGEGLGSRGSVGIWAVPGLGARWEIWVGGSGARRASPGQGVQAEPHVPLTLPAGCGCDPRGTLASHCAAGTCTCDHSTGACACRPNVVGKSCDRCAPHFWSLGGPGGCEPCGCHPTHALHPACDVVSPTPHPGTAPLPSRCPASCPAERAVLAAGDRAVPVPARLRGPHLLPVPGAPLGRPRAGVPRWGHMPGTGDTGALRVRGHSGYMAGL